MGYLPMEKDTLGNDKKGVLGEEYVRRHLESEGYKVVKRIHGERGFDLLASKGKKKLKVEIKTTGNLQGGISDMHSTEFYKKYGKWYLVADRLYILRIDAKFKPVQLDILTKAQVDRYAASHKTVIRVRPTKLQRDLYKGLIKIPSVKLKRIK